eukprot:8219972-Pyramimonas_sp.AAC.1
MYVFPSECDDFRLFGPSEDCSWRPLGTSWRPLGSSSASWSARLASRGPRGPSGRRLGAFLARLEPHVGPKEA